jgi:hypothetical protein
MLPVSRQAVGRRQNRRDSASSPRATYVLATIPSARRRDASGLPSRDQSTQQTEKSANERFQEIMSL